MQSSQTDSEGIRRPAVRLAFLDWTRGLAAVIMLQGHVFHAFTRTDARQGDIFVLSQFIGGMPPAIFLFLTGVTLAFLMDGQERRGVAACGRVTASLRRAGYLAILAVLFRLQLWLFGMPYSDWDSLFRVDILNSMAFGIAVMSVMAVFTTLERGRLCAILGLGIAAASPIISSLEFTSVPAYLRNYFVPSLEFFGFFPWAAFLAFGISAGSVLRLVNSGHLGQAVQWGGWMGVVLAFTAQYFSNLPFSIYAQSDFWLNSPGLVLIKLGVILMLTSFAFLWTTYATTGWSWVRQLGTTSLLIYWVHTELVYGRLFQTWKEGLSVSQTFAAAVVVIALMVGTSLAQSNWHRILDWMGLSRGRQVLPETE